MKIAIVGTGIAGLATAYYLHKANRNAERTPAAVPFELTVFEQEARIDDLLAGRPGANAPGQP